MAENENSQNQPETQADTNEAADNLEATAQVEETESEEPIPLSMQAIIDDLGRIFPNLDPHPHLDEWVEVFVDRSDWHEVALALRDQLGFDFLSLLSGVDYQEKGFQVVYHLLDLEANKKLVVKVDAPERDDPHVPSIMDVWPTANFHEREAWDLLGIRFDGHPDLRRILMREDWEGHPLRKDYVDDRVPKERQTRETYAEARRALRTREAEGRGQA